MSDQSSIGRPKLSRRGFITRGTTFAAACVIGCDAVAQSTPAKIDKALDDKKVVHKKVWLMSGPEKIDAYLARPVKRGRHPIVVLITGSSIDDEYIRNTASMLAQSGFVGIAPNIYSLQRPGLSPDENRKALAEKTTDKKIFRDVLSSIEYVRKQGFGNAKAVGVVGFCFGGRCALMFAHEYPDRVKAVIPFYGNLRTPAFANRQQDPIDVVEKIRTPIQGHYAEIDREIPLDQLQRFERSLQSNNAKSAIFVYPETYHGFFDYSDPPYDPGAARLSWSRSIEFLKTNLK